MKQKRVIKSQPNRQVFAAVTQLRERGFAVTHKNNPNGNGVVWSINGGEWLRDSEVWDFLNDLLHPTTCVGKPIRLTYGEVIFHSHHHLLRSPSISPADFFLAAYKELGGKPNITPATLHAEAGTMYILWRNHQIEQWATAVHAKHGTRLLAHEEKLLDMVEQVDEWYYTQLATSECMADEQTMAWTLAWSTAVLRWYHTVDAGRAAEALPASVEDAAKWLESVKLVPVATKTGQMSLFLGG